MKIESQIEFLLSMATSVVWPRADFYISRPPTPCSSTLDNVRFLALSASISFSDLRNSIILFPVRIYKCVYRLMEESEERVGRQCFRWASSVVLAWASLTAKEHGIATLPVAVLFDVTSTFHVKSALFPQVPPFFLFFPQLLLLLLPLLYF